MNTVERISTQSVGASGDRRVAVAALACAVLAGGNAVGIRLSNRELAPVWGAGLRFCLAGAALLIVVQIRKIAWPHGRALLGAALFGLLNFAGAFALGYYAFLHIEAGVGGAMLALVPLATLLFAVAHGQEALRPGAVVGGLVAVVGVAVISQASLSKAVPPTAVLAALGSVACFAEAAVMVRSFPPVHPLAMNAVGMTLAGAVLVAGAVVVGEPLAVPRHATTWMALGYLVPMGSIAVFQLYLVVLAHWPASRAVYIDVIVPLVTVVLSGVILGERMGADLARGGFLILLGVYLGAVRPMKPSRLSPVSSTAHHLRRNDSLAVERTN